MGKNLMCILLACALGFSNLTYADEATEETVRTPRTVSKLEKNRYDARKWTGYALAVGAVIIAVTTLILVSHHHNHHHRHDHKHK